MFEWVADLIANFPWEILWTMLPVFGFGGGSDTSSTTITQEVEPATPEDLEQKKLNLESSQINLEQQRRQQAIQNALFFGTPLPPEFGGPEGLDDSLVQQTIDAERAALPLETQLREQQAQFDLSQLENLQSLGSLPFDVQRLQLESAADLIPRQNELTQAQLELANQQIGFSQNALPLQQRLLEEEVARVERGGLPSPEIEEKINQAIQQSKEIGISDIQELAGSRTRELIASAASRGLRPEDSPILGEASLIGQEETRQIGQLERGLESARLQGLIQQPLNVAQALGPISASLLGPALGGNAQAVSTIPGASPFGNSLDSSGLLQNAQQFAQSFGSQRNSFRTAGSAGAAFGAFAPSQTFGPQFFATSQQQSQSRGGDPFLKAFGSGLGGIASQGVGLATAGFFG